jgi:hypothetical protein
VGGKGITADKAFFVNDKQLPPSGLAEMQTKSDTFITFAAAPGGVAYDGLRQESLSPFTQALVKYLDIVDLPLANLSSRVRQDVLNKTNGQQRTWDQSSLMSPFYFSPGSILFFTGNFLAVIGLVVAVLIFTLVFATGRGVGLDSSIDSATILLLGRTVIRGAKGLFSIARRDELASGRKLVSTEPFLCLPEKRLHRRLPGITNCRYPTLRSLLLAVGRVGGAR